MRRRIKPILLLLLLLAADQASKWYLLHDYNIAERAPVVITSFFNLVMVWNPGVSFGMLAEQDARWFLTGLALGISMILLFWLWRTHERMLPWALALIISGAVGNAIDRIQYGAVADFFDVHISGYHWPAFNIADSAIVCGALLMLLLQFRKS